MPGRQGVGGSNPPCSTKDTELRIGAPRLRAPGFSDPGPQLSRARTTIESTCLRPLAQAGARQPVCATGFRQQLRGGRRTSNWSTLAGVSQRGGRHVAPCGFAHVIGWFCVHHDHWTEGRGRRTGVWGVDGLNHSSRTNGLMAERALGDRRVQASRTPPLLPELRRFCWRPGPDLH